MPTPLMRLLASIHPQRTLHDTARSADDAINSFPLKSAQITDWETYRRCIADFGRHVDTRILKLRNMPSTDLDFAWGLYSKVLRKAYGSNGEKAAFEMARTGVSGGLLAVLRKFAQLQATQYAENEIRGRIFHYWEKLTVDQKLRAVDEYLTTYGHLLPSEMTEGDATRLRMNFPGVLAEHPRLLRRLGEVGR
jgi:hypothetical protein